MSKIVPHRVITVFSHAPREQETKPVVNSTARKSFGEWRINRLRNYNQGASFLVAATPHPSIEI